jgi:RNAse (barnase) inhibitor barstar
MNTVDVVLDTEEIVDWKSFHDACNQTFGFPDFYGRNMDAWIDCMSYLDEGGGMTKFHLLPDEMLNIQLRDSGNFRVRNPEIFGVLVDCSAFVNQRYIERSVPIRVSITAL